MTNFMEGKKTWTSLAVLLAGLTGLADVVTEANVAELINSIAVIAGFVGAVYGYAVTKRGAKG
tara:strand:- start:406 stop:594 length:189 start_codon:yes stop_codon:yes gene_type:complete